MIMTTKDDKKNIRHKRETSQREPLVFIDPEGKRRKVNIVIMVIKATKHLF